ncbi:FIST C-terminal domain-containing protein [Desulforamulus hydrothermalis]|uniref:FIST C domain n=1 Tax=Desulforamulus hydrothermalis Lam5 = DSM 18033 TaxID=1121428 RepID=K8DXF2_9FIRM|nr:FIST C-terminal domain-containing protein [Desulforamulus hydrothermalis]CCO07297.1 FIST C domain [Desulforamulus hydrothermalis Lam5 = DSM 18033]SHG93454.1 FIST N domain-containing protein [Desulforamulus hydrothermalis Lam5 = DSM 18033]
MLAKAVYFKPTDFYDWFAFFNNLQGEGTCGIFLMVAEHTPFDYEMLRPLFNEAGVPVFGGIFPGVIYEDNWYTEGVVGCSIEQPIFLDVVSALPDFKGFACQAAAAAGSLLVLLDGRADGITDFLDHIFETAGSRWGIMGGGAGSLAKRHRHVLFTQEANISGGAIMVRTNSLMGVGVAHGWQPMFGPLVANCAIGKEVKELNWQKAFSGYRQFIWEAAGVHIDKENFFQVAKNYPLGMVKLDGRVIVRDAIGVTEDDALVMVGEIPANSIVVLLHGEPGRLIEAAAEAAQLACTRYQQLAPNNGRHVLLMDCISRALFLGDDFKREIVSIKQNLPSGMPLIGVLSLGEIASNGVSYLDFYNKSTVVGVLS